MNTDFKIQQAFDGKSFIFTDTTSYTEVELNNIVETKLHIKMPDGIKYTIFSTYHPSQGDWEVFSTDLKGSNRNITDEIYTPSSDCGCTGVVSPIGSLIPFHYLYDYVSNENCQEPDVITNLIDGCYEFTYETYSTGLVNDIMCTYTANTYLCEGARFYVRMGLSYVDMTDSLSINNGNASFSQRAYVDQFNDWHVKKGQQVLETGTFEVTNCQLVGTTTEYLYPKLSGSKTYQVPFFAQTKRKLVDKSYLVYKDKAFVSDSVINSATDTFLVAHTKLEMAILYPPCDCDCISKTVDSVNILLDSLKEKGDDC